MNKGVGNPCGIGEREPRWIFINILISSLATLAIFVCWLMKRTKITSVNWIRDKKW